MPPVGRFHLLSTNEMALRALLGRPIRAERVRRNHALEHATITIVSQRNPRMHLSGRSNRKGFYVFGEVDTEVLRSALQEAYDRLRGGERELAIHPRCGTNLAVAGILSGVAAALASSLRPRENRFTYAVLASLGALMVAPPLGTATQRHVTTEPDLGDLRIESIEPRTIFGHPAHWVRTRSS